MNRIIREFEEEHKKFVWYFFRWNDFNFLELDLSLVIGKLSSNCNKLAIEPWKSLRKEVENGIHDIGF